MGIPVRRNAPDFPPPAATPDKLTALVENGDLAGLRTHFDATFWENRAERPGWDHLKIALLHGDRQMLRLLHAWGAAPSDNDLAAFRLAVKDKYPDYLKVLRAAGLRPQNAPWETLAPAEAEIPRAAIEKRAYEIYQENGHTSGQEVQNWLKAEEDLQERLRAQQEKEAAAEAARLDAIVAKRDAAQLMKKVPQQWLSALKCLQAAGAGEAVIAGESLSDVFMGRPPGAVNFFLLSRGDPRKNEKFLKKALADAGIPAAMEAPADVTPANGHSSSPRSQHWKIRTGDPATGYDVAFMDPQPGSPSVKAAFLTEILNGFDVGLRQVACDGQSVVTTAAYKSDIASGHISLLAPRAPGDAKDLTWLKSRYPGSEFNDAAKRAVETMSPRVAPAPAPPPIVDKKWFF